MDAIAAAPLGPSASTTRGPIRTKTTLASGVLNTYGNFPLPAFAPVLLNVSFIVAALVVAPHLKVPVFALAWAVIVGGVLQFVVQWPGLRRIEMTPRIFAVAVDKAGTSSPLYWTHIKDKLVL